MHLNWSLLSSIVTVVWFVAFVALCLWAWSARRHKDFNAAAHLPFDDATDTPAPRREGGR
jgi:cytochrome c oxidase cbb3-type subunit IV